MKLINSKKIKLCFVISSLRAGGAERVVSILANSFDEKGSFDVSIVTINKALSFYVLSDTIQLISLDIQNDKTAIRNSQIRVTKLTKVFKTIKPTIVISFNTTTSCEAIIAAQFRRIPIIVSERANPKTSANSRYWKILRRLTFPIARHLVCQTESSKEFYHWVKNKSVIKNPVNQPNIEIRTKEKTILAVGSLRFVKGFDLLIDAFVNTMLSRNKKDWDLIILGEGAERFNLENKILNSGFENNIHLKGRVSNTSKYYTTSSIFALSSRSEGMPNVLLEALSFGLPSVAFDCEFGPSEILEGGEIGLLAKDGDIVDLSYKLKLLMDNEKLRETLSKKAIKKAKEFSKETVTEDWWQLINNILTK